MFNKAEQFSNQMPEAEPAPKMEQEVKEHPPVDAHEHTVDIESPEIKEKIEEAKKLFREFYYEYVKKLDLGNEYIEEIIDHIYEKAAEKGIFSKAQEIRELIFDKNISIYGVCYLSNKCGSNQCTFCPMGRMCRMEWELEEDLQYYKNLAKENPKEMNKYDIKNMRSLAQELCKIKKQVKALTPLEATKDMKALVEMGHTEICILAGEELAPDKKKKKFSPNEEKVAVKSANDPDEIIKYTQMALDRDGVKEVILNIGAFSESVFRYIKENLKIPENVTLQFRIFQETYDRISYAKYLRYAPDGCHNKKDYDFRYYSQINALLAGFPEVGIGVLLGLSPLPLEEIFQLGMHADVIKRIGGKEPKRCCMPIANDPNYNPEIARLRKMNPAERREEIMNQVNALEKNYKDDASPDEKKYMQKLHEILSKLTVRPEDVEIEYFIPGIKNEQKLVEIMYALLRLIIPTISIVSSERDTPEMLEILDKYANHTTLNVHPYPGGNMEALRETRDEKTSEQELVAQAEVFPRDPKEAIASWRERGYNVLGFDVEKYKNQ